MKRFVLMAALLAAPFVARGQEAACTYQACALRLAPVWNGLDVVKGAQGQRVTGLGFFWVSDIRPALAANDSALRYAREAMHVRRVAALLTDAGGAALAFVAVRGIANGTLSRGDRVAAAAGGAAFVASVPLQFVADGLLSKSVWWFNSSLRR
ncbi:MAG: hypothetical protein ABIY52_11755 [Gemmatimonadaceae bacterium]